MKKLMKTLGVTIALTAIGVAVRARVKENKIIILDSRAVGDSIQDYQAKCPKFDHKIQKEPACEFH